MKISSINSLSTDAVSRRGSAVSKYGSRTALSFSHTAVPYPEYTNTEEKKDDIKGIIEELVGKVSNLFHPHVQKEAADIKANIDSLCEKKEQPAGVASAPQKLLSVFA